MKRLKNWDNKTWLSSKKYISAFNNFLKSKIKFNKTIKILDIGCGRANIIGSLQKKYNFKNKPIGVDIVKSKNIKKNIIFIKNDAISFLQENDKNFDIILIKQTIHFFNEKQVKKLLRLAKTNLTKKGQLLIFSLKIKNNEIPCFQKMKLKLNKSLKKDLTLFKIIRSKLKKSKETYFRFKVDISKPEYISMIKKRYISCLLNFSEKDLNTGINEINLKYKNHICFKDTLKCISYRNN